MTNIVQLLDEKTGNNVAPITHWDAVSNKPDLVTRSELSGVAQQGDNPDVSLTSIDEKIDGFYDTFDADIALQLQGIIGDTEESESESESESIEGTSQTATQVEELRTLQESYDELVNSQTSLANSINELVINKRNLGGYKFIDNTIPECVGDILFNGKANLIEIDDDIITTMTSKGALDSATKLTSIKFNNLQRIDVTEVFKGCTLLSHVEMPSVTYIANDVFWNCTSLVSVEFPELLQTAQYLFENCTSLREFKAPKLTNIPARVFWGCTSIVSVYTPNAYNIAPDNFSNLPKLINIELGRNATSAISLVNWSPTEALSSESSSLVEPGETFASNLEKLLYNIREHIAANLPDRTGLSVLTITFSAAVKAAILADTDTANAFADKYWTVA